MINQEQQQKLEDLKQQQQKLEESIKTLETSLKTPQPPQEKLLTSQLTNEGEEARRKYFEGNVGILCKFADGISDLYQIMDDPDDRSMYFERFDADEMHPYILYGCPSDWICARQAKPQKGVWYWREDENDVPPEGSRAVVLAKGGAVGYDMNIDNWRWSIRKTSVNSDIIAYMLL